MVMMQHRRWHQNVKDTRSRGGIQITAMLQVMLK